MIDADHICQNVPACLLQPLQWVGWKLVRRHGRETKLPIDPKTGDPASSTDPTTWTCFDDAVSACRRFAALAGVGFVFTAADDFCGIDLDDCIDAAPGQLKPWGLRMVRTLNSYTEISPSGTGVKVFVRARKPGDSCRKPFEDGEIEVYDRTRFFAVTGQRLDDVSHEVEARQEEVEAVYAEVFGKVSTPSEMSSPGKGMERSLVGDDGPMPVLTDDDILNLAMSSHRRERGDKFAALWAGKWNDHFNSPSEADSSVVFTLAYYTKNAAQIDRLFRRSGLYRAKWDEP